MIEDTNKVVIFITSTEAEAPKIARALLNGRKAACVNIVPRVNSFFLWENELDSAQESLLIVKTEASLLKNVIALVREIHSYDVPEIIALPIVGGNPDYLNWLSQEIR